MPPNFKYKKRKKFNWQVFEFNTNECGCSLASLSLGNDPTPYYAIGTAIGLEEDMDSKLV